MVRLGIIARSDDSGLGIQTQLLHKMLKPHKTLAIDFSEFKGDYMKPHWGRFEGNVRQHKGFLDKEALEWITDDVDCVLTAEIDYAQGGLYLMARSKGVKSFVHFNYEFLENLKEDDFPMPDVFIAPSPWNIRRLPTKIRGKMVSLDLPVESNWQEKKDKSIFLHVIGKSTKEDRNGTKLVFEALKYTDENFTLNITHQDQVDMPNDPRIKDLGYVEDLKPLYREAGHLLMPRRFGGQSLVIQEAMASNCIPILLENDPYEIGRKIESRHSKRIRVYTFIDVYTCHPQKLAKAIHSSILDDGRYKEPMREYMNSHTIEAMKPQWEAVLNR